MKRELRLEFNDFFKLLNEEIYLVNQETIDCCICQSMIINPRICKECGTLYCKACLDKNSSCSKNCPNYEQCEPSAFHLKSLEKIKLKCKFGCEVNLNEAFKHMSECEKSKMDIECWNCKKKTCSDNLKITEEKLREIQMKLTGDSNNDGSRVNIRDKEELTMFKLLGYRNLIGIEENKRKLNDQIHEIKVKLQTKETISLMIQRLESSLKQGETIDQLKINLEEKALEMNKLNEEKERQFKELNEVNEENIKLFKTKEVKDNKDNKVINLNEGKEVGGSSVQDEKSETSTKMKMRRRPKQNVVKLKEQKLVGHKNPVLNLIKLNETTIISASGDATHSGEIKIWDLLSESCLKTLDGHSDSIYCIIKISGSQFASVRKDKTIQIFDISSNKCVLMLTGHNHYVYCLYKLNDNEIASGSWDKTIKIWDLTNGNCLKTLSGHLKAVSCIIKLSDNYIVSGSLDKSIKIWDLKTSTCLKTFSGHVNTVSCLVNIGEGHFASGSLDKTIKIWDSQKDTFLKSLTGHTDWVNCLIKLGNSHLVSGSKDNTIKVWDCITGNSIKTLSGHEGYVDCLVKMNETQVASGSEDTTIRIWDI